MPNVIPALADINIPAHVNIRRMENFEELITEIGRRSVMGYAGESFFGTAFIQGSRLQFTTAMPVQKMIDVSKMDRSRKKDSVRAVMEHSNRPQEASHAKHVRSYLMRTACTGEKFILPAFTFNYGVGLDEEAPSATLLIYAASDDGTNSWPALLLLPQGAKLDTTDGAHRRSQIEDILFHSRATDEEKDALRRNAVDVKIVFESSRTDSHQDFADCGKAKSIPKSLVATFDVRDRRNRRSKELVNGNEFLAHYVDATAANVNLSSKSKMIWSMSAIRMFVGHIVDHHEEPDLSEDEKTTGAESFFTALVRHLPQLRALDQARLDPASTTSTGSLRDVRGGDVALRGIGMAIFARAFLHCKENGMDFDEMAKRLAKIDWHILDCERTEITSGPTFAEEVRNHADPIWGHLLVVGDNRYRVSSSSSDADAAWAKIEDAVLPELSVAAE